MRHWLLLLCFTVTAYSQEVVPPNAGFHRKGSVFVSYGGNTGDYTKSDIRFRGNGYDFTLRDVRAHDLNKGFTWEYVVPTGLSLNQCNLRIGYFLNDTFNISLSIDHMKYELTQYQTVAMDGYISNHFPYNGTYQGEQQILSPEFIKYEHTDGLNFVNIGIERLDPITDRFGVNPRKFQVCTTLGADIGILVPKTDSELMSQKRHDNYHISGYGLDLNAGLNLTFFRYFFIQGGLKGGFINMPSIRTTEHSSDKASQHFFFGQANLVIGAIVKV